MTILKKLTPAQVDRLRQVQRGEITRWGHDLVSMSFFSHEECRCPGKYPMWLTLTKGGMVDWDPMPEPKGYLAPRFKAVLTNAGAKLLSLNKRK